MARRINKGRRDRGTSLDQSRFSLAVRFFPLLHSLFLLLLLFIPSLLAATPLSVGTFSRHQPSAAATLIPHHRGTFRARAYGPLNRDHARCSSDEECMRAPRIAPR